MINSYEKLANILKKTSTSSYSDTVIGEIIVPPPEDPCIKILGFSIKENIFFANTLLKGNEREMDIEELKIDLDEIDFDFSKFSLKNTKPTESAAGPPGTPHIHTHVSLSGAGNVYATNGSIRGKGNAKLICRMEPLKKGDKVIVQIDSDNRFFYVIDKFKKF